MAPGNRVSDVDEFLNKVKAGDVAAVESMLAADPELKAARTSRGTHAAVLAVFYGKKAVADAIVRHGPELNIFDASVLGDVGRVKDLVEQDPTLVNAVDGTGNAPLGLAAFTGQLEIVEFLLAQGAEVNYVSPDENAFTALTGAVANGNLDVVRILLNHGADPNHRYEAGAFSPLLAAAAEGKADVARALLDAGADPNLKGGDGKTALALALEKGHEAVAQILRDAGAAP